VEEGTDSVPWQVKALIVVGLVVSQPDQSLSSHRILIGPFLFS
jgi:hypothetical protein